MADLKSFRTHREWEDWLGIAVGVLILLAPWIVNETSNRSAVINAALSGLAVLAFAELDLVRLRRWAEWGLLVCGTWVALSPYILSYAGSGTLHVWHLVAGLIAAMLGALGIWQQTNPSK